MESKEEKYYLIHFNFNDEDDDINITKFIITLGDYYPIAEDLYFVKTKLLSKEMFDLLPHPESLRDFLITEIMPSNTYGMEHVNAWKFLGIFTDKKEEEAK